MEAGQLGGQGQTIDNLHILSVNNDSDKCRRLSGGSDNVKCEVVDFVPNVIVTEAEYSEDLVAAVQEDTNKEEDENPASELVTRMADCEQKARLMPTLSVIHEEGGAGQEYQVAAEFYRLWCDDTVTVKFLKVFDSFPFTTIVHTVN